MPDLVVYRDGSKENPKSKNSSGNAADLLGKNGQSCWANVNSSVQVN